MAASWAIASIVVAFVLTGATAFPMQYFPSDSYLRKSKSYTFYWPKDRFSASTMYFTITGYSYCIFSDTQRCIKLDNGKYIAHIATVPNTGSYTWTSSSTRVPCTSCWAGVVPNDKSGAEPGVTSAFQIESNLPTQFPTKFPTSSPTPFPTRYPTRRSSGTGESCSCKEGKSKNMCECCTKVPVLGWMECSRATLHVALMAGGVGGLVILIAAVVFCKYRKRSKASMPKPLKNDEEEIRRLEMGSMPKGNGSRGPEAAYPTAPPATATALPITTGLPVANAVPIEASGISVVAANPATTSAARQPPQSHAWHNNDDDDDISTAVWIYLALSYILLPVFIAWACTMTKGPRATPRVNKLTHYLCIWWSCCFIISSIVAAT